ncbi:hypothetical protein ACWAT4_21375 [Bradyrhizobium manausense]
MGWNILTYSNNDLRVFDARLLRAFVRWWWLILGGALLAALAFFAVNPSLPGAYRSSAVVRLTPAQEANFRAWQKPGPEVLPVRVQQKRMKITFREAIGPSSDTSRVLYVEAYGDTPEQAHALVADNLDEWLRSTPFDRLSVIVVAADLPQETVHAERGTASLIAGFAALPVMAIISLALSYPSARAGLAVLANPTIGTVLLIFVVTDLALGGNGYLAQVGSVRLRDLLFILCMIWAVASVVARPECRPPRAIWWLLAIFCGVTSFGFLYGYLAGNFDTGYVLSAGRPAMEVNTSSVAAIMLELKPLLYFPMLLFFVVAIRSRHEVTTVVSIVVASGVLLASSYLLLLLSAKLGLVSYGAIYDTLGASDEFIFRHTVDKHAPFVGFFYKGMFYVCIAAILLSLDPFKLTKIAGTVAVAAVAFTLTRSLTFALALCLVVSVIMTHDRRAFRLIGQLVVLVAFTLFAHNADKSLPPEVAQGAAAAAAPSAGNTEGTSIVESLGRRTDSYRSGDIRFVADHLDLRTLLIGRGFGAKIDQRSRIELNYLEILYKQGLLGLATWFLLFGLTCWLYARTPSCNRALALALALSSLFVFVSTAATTFLTGSIGMGMVFITIAALIVLSREGKPVAWYSGWPNRVPT